VINAPVTLDEWSLIDELRDIPDDAARADLTAQIRDLIRFSHHPLCPHAQADGVPCASVSTSWDQCQGCQIFSSPWLRRSLSASSERNRSDGPLPIGAREAERPG
jgi:hypothetical protein